MLLVAVRQPSASASHWYTISDTELRLETREILENVYFRG